MQPKPQDANKLYSLHEPQVRCISKGKTHKRYEFGRKVAVATTNGGNWMVAAMLLPDNPYDGSRRAGIKSDHRMDRCFLAGLVGDAMNAVLAAAGSNLRKLLRRLAAALIRWLHETMHRPASLIHRLAMTQRAPQSAIAA